MQSLRQIKDQEGARSYRNPRLMKFFVRDHGGTLEEAEALFAETLEFIVLTAMMGGGISPTKRVDEMWHFFILETKDYREFCEAYIGHFVDHVRTDEALTGRAEEATQVAIQLFGDPRSVYDLSLIHI